MALLNDNAAWVAARLAALPDAVRFEAGASVTIDGAEHPIRHAPGARGRCLAAGRRAVCGGRPGVHVTAGA
ncbi:MAG: hypothetical protein WDN04_07260 [Rhodospirillales bacterium]